MIAAGIENKKMNPIILSNNSKISVRPNGLGIPTSWANDIFHPKNSIERRTNIGTNNTNFLNMFLN